MGGLTVRPDLAHRWDLAPQEAIALQRRLAERVRREPDLGEVRRVAGVDASYRNQTAVGAVVVLDYPTLTVVDYVVARCPVTYPYVPGLLSFREAPAVLQALAQIKVVPDLLIFDGHGIAHPRRLGLASHIGVLLDVPSIGCAAVCRRCMTRTLTRSSARWCGHGPTSGLCLSRLGTGLTWTRPFTTC